jgi:hypothetical protein
MPDRLAEVINVLDWGAKGDGVTNDTPAIQAAIQEAIRRGGGRVIFPRGDAGRYYIGSPGYLTVGSSKPDIRVELIGIGYASVRLGFTTTSGVAISRGAQTYDNLSKLQGFLLSTAAGSDYIKLEGTSQSIIDVRFETIRDGRCGIDASAATGAMIVDVTGVATTNNPVNTAFPPGPGAVPGTVGMYLGNGCVAYDCRLQSGCDIAFALSGIGAAVIGTSMEVHRTGIKVGWGPGGETTAYGFSIIGCQFEAVDVSIDLYNCQSGFISGTTHQGQVPHTEAWGDIQNITWAPDNGGTATVTTTLNHNIPPGNYVLQIDRLSTAYFGPYAGGQRPGPGFIIAVVGGVANQFTYYLKNNPGTYPTGGRWNYAQPYAMRFRKVENVAIMGVGTGMNCALATLDFDYDGQAQNHRNNVLYGAAINYGVRLPQASNPNRRKILAGWNFYGCSGTVSMLDGFGWRGSGFTAASPSGHMVFADLPGQSGYQDGPYEGQDFDIMDSTVANTSFGAVVTSGGGSYAVRVRWNGAAWTITG